MRILAIAIGENMVQIKRKTTRDTCVSLSATLRTDDSGRVKISEVKLPALESLLRKYEHQFFCGHGCIGT